MQSLPSKKALSFELTCILLVAVGVSLRFFRLSFQSVWLDELINLRDASHPFPEIHRAIMASPPLFHYIVHGILSVFGQNPFWLRFPSAVFGCLTTLFIGVIARRLFGPRAGTWVTLLYAVSVFDIFFSQEMRMYALVALEALLSTYFWNRAIEKDKWGDWVKFGAMSLLGLFTHNWFPFLLASQGLWFVGERIYRKESMLRGLVTFVCLGLAYIPWIPMVIRQAKLPVYGHMHSPGLKDWLSTWAAFAGLKVSSGESLLMVSSYLLPVALAISLAFLAAGAFWPGPGRARSIRLFFAGMLLPISFAFVESVVGKPVYAADRYTIIALPAYFLVVSRAFQVVNERWYKVLVAAAIAWVGCSGSMLYRYYFDYQKAPGKSIAAFIDANRSPNTPVTLCSDPSRSDWGLYLYTQAEIEAKPLEECKGEGEHYVVLEARDPMPPYLKKLRPTASAAIGTLVIYKMK